MRIYRILQDYVTERGAAFLIFVSLFSFFVLNFQGFLSGLPSSLRVFADSKAYSSHIYDLTVSTVFSGLISRVIYFALMTRRTIGDNFKSRKDQAENTEDSLSGTYFSRASKSFRSIFSVTIWIIIFLCIYVGLTGAIKFIFYAIFFGVFSIIYTIFVPEKHHSSTYMLTLAITIWISVASFLLGSLRCIYILSHTTRIDINNSQYCASLVMASSEGVVIVTRIDDTASWFGPAVKESFFAPYGSLQIIMFNEEYQDCSISTS
jgi:hypothetical protein